MRRLVLIGMILGLLLGCSPPKETRYYLLEYVPQPSQERLARGPWPARVRLKDFSIAEAYRRNQIVYRASAHEMRFYNYELWAVKPEYLVTDMLFRHFRDARMFQELTRSVEQEEADYILKGEVTALEEYDNEDQWYAHLALAMSLQNSRTLEVVWSHTWDYRKKVQRQEPVFVVRELSVLLERIVVEATQKLDVYFAKKAIVDPVEEPEPPRETPGPISVQQPLESQPDSSVLPMPNRDSLVSDKDSLIPERQEETLPVPTELPPPVENPE